MIHNDITTADGEFDIFIERDARPTCSASRRTYFTREQPHGPPHPAESRQGSR